MCLIDTIMLGYGVESRDGLVLPVVQRHTVLPTRKTVRLRWDEPSGAWMPLAGGPARVPSNVVPPPPETRPVRVFQGERALVRDNSFVGEAEVPVAAGGTAAITFEINENEQLTVNGVLIGDGQRLSVEWAEQHIHDAETAATADSERRRAVLEEAGVSEADFLRAGAMYQSDVLPPPPELDGIAADIYSKQ